MHVVVAAVVEQAKEFVRRMLIGRDVHVTMEYTRADRVEGGGEGQIRKFATVTLSRKVYANDTPPLRVVDVCPVSPLCCRRWICWDDERRGVLSWRLLCVASCVVRRGQGME